MCVSQYQKKTDQERERESRNILFDKCVYKTSCEKEQNGEGTSDPTVPICNRVDGGDEGSARVVTEND